jgi:hypothetical protein
VYFVLGVAAQTRLEGHQRALSEGLAAGGSGDVQYHVSYGTYVGLAGAALALLGAVLGGPLVVSVRPPLRHLCAAALATGFLGALLLPWQQAGFASSVRVTELGVADPPGAIAAVAALGLLLAAWAGAGERTLELVGLALVALLFAAAAFTVGFGVVHAYGAWIGLAFALLAALVVLADRSLLRRTDSPSAYKGAAVIAGAALVTSLFLPWQTACYGQTADLKSVGLAGRCVSSNGLGLVGSTAALLTIVLVFLVAGPGSGERVVSRFELVTGVGVLVATLGFQLQTGSGSGVRLGIGYGSIVGFVAAAALGALVLAGARWRWVGLRAVAPALLPIVLGALYVTVVVLAWWWNVLPHASWLTFIARFAPVSWLKLASALLGIRLVYLWARQPRDVSDRGPELVLVSLALVVLGVLHAVPLPTVQLDWNGGLLLGVSGSLTLLALIEERGGFRELHVPDILRVDRI